MRKVLRIFIMFITLCHGAHAAATRDAELTNTTGYNYNYMYPYLSNQMRTSLNPGVTTSQSTNPVNVFTRTKQMGPARNVVPRPTASARTATVARVGTASAMTARAVRPRTAPTTEQNNTRRVVARSGTAPARITEPQNARVTIRTNQADEYKSVPTNESTSISSTRCLADYSACMDNYCKRENTKYNRCYCSAKLAQIDSKYQPEIDSLITQVLKLKNTSYWSDDEMNEYWMSVFDKYSDTNSWENIDSALNIDWASMDSRVRGQNAFATGHEYCVQHLRGCDYMASNIRNAYRSEIGRDCGEYEQYLQSIRNAAESIVEAYK